MNSKVKNKILIFFDEDEDLVVGVDGDPPGLSLAEVPDVAGPMVLSARQQ